MAKIKTVFSCQKCGYQSPRWLGRCPDCEGWNTLVEEIMARPANPQALKRGYVSQEEPKLLSEVEVKAGFRTKTNIAEFDRILGGGLVTGSVTLIGGDPGIGKSTLLLQVSNNLKNKVLYVSGEESIAQTKLRAERLGVKSDNLYIVCETDLDLIIGYIEKIKPEIVIIDSIQVVFRPDISSSPGSVSQVRESAGQLTVLAKAKGVSIFLVGHVTKDGALAGPRVLEHIVDTVLYFEGDRHHSYRILRAVKNRFGSTNEIGVFEMTEAGLKEVLNPSEMFLGDRPKGVTGSVVVPTMEGTRPLLVELQALVSPTHFGLPRRRTTGFDFNRMCLLLAVLEKRAGLGFGTHDVFVNVVGGIKVIEPAVDLGVVIALASALKEKPVAVTDLVIGEVGLAGEVRPVSLTDKRVQEAKRMGFKRCILPKANLKSLKSIKGIELIGVDRLNQALEAAIS